MSSAIWFIALRSCTKWVPGFWTGRMPVLYGDWQRQMRLCSRKADITGWIPFLACSLKGYCFKFGILDPGWSFTCTGVTIFALLGLLSAQTSYLTFCRISSGNSRHSVFPSYSNVAWSEQVCSGGTLMSILSWEKVTLAFSLLKKSRPSRGIGHSGMYRETASNKSPIWHSSGFQKGFWRGFGDSHYLWGGFGQFRV